jgi:hypothetical protein
MKDIGLKLQVPRIRYLVRITTYVEAQGTRVWPGTLGNYGWRQAYGYSIAIYCLTQGRLGPSYLLDLLPAVQLR